MFTIKEEQNQFKTYELRDEKAQSWFKVAPERGGIIYSFGVKGEELLYLEEATFNDRTTSVRGGIPILFPICGQLEGDQYRWNSREYKMKPHGFARNLPWEVIRTDSNDKASITIRLLSNEQTRAQFPLDFELRFTYTLKGNQLVIDQEYINLSEFAMPVYAGFHPYFKVGDKSKLIYHTNSTLYLDYADKSIKPFGRSFDMSDVSVARLLLNHTNNEILFEDPALKHKISYKYSKEFKYFLFWSLVGKDFLCVEPFMAKMNALNSNEDLYHISPKGTLRLSWTISGDILV
jgi:galactose mutarotase-like enzyme